MTEQIEAPAAAEPSPISEAPVEAPQEAPSDTPSRMEALEKAFKTVDDGETPKAEPEETPNEAPKAEEKAEDKPKADADGPARGPDGKFVAKDAPKENEAPKEPEAAPATTVDAPARFSADAKAAWKDAPAAVQGEIHRAVREMEQGLADKDAILEPLKPYMDLAKQHNTDIPTALDRYVNMERLLQSNPVVGLRQLAQNLGWTPEQMAGLVLHNGEGQPADANSTMLQQMQQTVGNLQTSLQNVTQTQQQQQEKAIEAEIAAFAADHPRFNELEPEIARLLETNYAADLKQAYEIADRLNPAPQVEPTPAPTPPAAQTRPAKSVTGAPTSGSNPAHRQPSKTRNEALARAFAQTGLA